MINRQENATVAHQVYLGLGSNLGDREQTLRQAIALIGRRVGTVVRQSSFLVTEPWGFSSAHAFVNAVVCCATTLTPRDVLRATQQIERELGKTGRHATRRVNDRQPAYRDRPIDIDILLYDDIRVDEPGLTIPHPHMYERDFVMTPLREIYNTNH